MCEMKVVLRVIFLESDLKDTITVTWIEVREAKAVEAVVRVSSFYAHRLHF